MSYCDQHWCEHYDKGHSQCEKCEKKSQDKDPAELRVMLKKRAVEQMGLDKNKGQKR